MDDIVHSLNIKIWDTSTCNVGILWCTGAILAECPSWWHQQPYEWQL